MFISKETEICVECLIKRYLEGFSNEFYDLINELEETIFIFEDKISSLISIMKNLKNLKIGIYDKKTESYYSSQIICFPDCKNFIFPTVSRLNNYDSNGTSHRENKILNLDNFIGRLSPVTYCEDLSQQDNFYYPVYGAISASKREEKKYTYHGGKGINHEQAKESAIGECLERYSARMFGYEKIILESEETIAYSSLEYLSPSDLFPLKELNYSQSKKIEWVYGKNLKNNNDTLIPANVVFFPYIRDKNLHFTSQTTTGLAAGTTLNEAILQGILEIIERNYYSTLYRNNDINKEICDIELLNIASLNIPWLNSVYKNFKLNLTLLSKKYGVYVVHCVLESKKKFPKATHGSGAALDLGIAIRRAICEAFQLRTSQIILENTGEIMQKEYIAYKEWGYGNEDYYSIFLNKQERNKVIYNVENMPTNNISLKLLNDSLNKVGYEVFFYDLSRKDVPLKSVRVIIPGMQDIDNEFNKITRSLTAKEIINRKVLFT